MKENENVPPAMVVTIIGLPFFFQPIDFRVRLTPLITSCRFFGHHLLLRRRQSGICAAISPAELSASRKLHLPV